MLAAKDACNILRRPKICTLADSLQNAGYRSTQIGPRLVLPPLPRGEGGKKGEGRDGTKEERHGGDVKGLLAKFHVNAFIVSASGSGGQKPQFWANFDIWGLLYRPPFTDEGQIWWVGADPRSTLTRQISSECVHCVAQGIRPCGAFIPHFGQI